MRKKHDQTVPANGATKRSVLSLRPKGNAGDDFGPAPEESAVSLDFPRAEFEPTAREPQLDYATPRALRDQETFDWYDESPLIENFAGLGAALAKAGDLFRRTTYGGGLLLASADPRILPTPIDDAESLAPVLVDRVRVRLLKKGKVTRSSVPAAHLATMLHTEAFLQRLRPVDAVERQSRYLPDFSLTRPGLNDGGYGQRILHIGPAARIESGHDAIARFLDVMDFEGEADRTNAVAAALTVLLRNFWPGAKPVIVVTSSKSHGGKETIVSFAAGTTRQVSIGYETKDWALQKAFVVALKAEPTIGLVDVENARLDRNSNEIKSAFLERFLTDAEPLLFSPGTGPPVRRFNDLVVAITTNFGAVSEDLLNRALPIHLTPVGDVAGRRSPIGNPKLEYLPANRERIEAELRGLIERWKEEGRPTDDAVSHPCREWAPTVGGILMANGFGSFLDNYALRKTADDPLRRGLGLLGAARPGEWQAARDWATLVRSLGLVRSVIPEGDRDSDVGIERGLGRVLSAHVDETFVVETEDERLTLKLEKARLRFETGAQPQTRYRFAVLEAGAIPADPERAKDGDGGPTDEDP